MKEKVVSYFFFKIKNNNKNLSAVKLEEIKYGLYGVYTLVTKTSAIILLSILLNFFDKFIIFLLFYSLIRSVGYGTHAKSNLMCWIFSTILLLGIPYIFSILTLNNLTKSIIWSICFINYLIFSPADTEKRPMINKYRKLKFKFGILLLSFIYLVIIIKFNNISNLVLSAMTLEAILTNPLGYLLMGEKIRFRLDDLNIFNLN